MLKSGHAPLWCRPRKRLGATQATPHKSSHAAGLVENVLAGVYTLRSVMIMKIKYWCHSNVLPDGSFENDPSHFLGKVNPKASMNTSGSHHLQTPSSVAAGLWMSVCTGRLEGGDVHGITIYFESEKEMQNFEQTREATLRR